jgi:hypothetical protein
MDVPLPAPAKAVWRCSPTGGVGRRARAPREQKSKGFVACTGCLPTAPLLIDRIAGTSSHARAPRRRIDFAATDYEQRLTNKRAHSAIGGR